MTSDPLVPAGTWLKRLATNVLLQFIAFAFFIGFPSLFTAIAPVSWVKLKRQGEHVDFSAKTCLLFVVPYHTAHVSEVVGFGERVKSGTVNRYRKPGRDRVTRSEDEGFLVVEGKGGSVEIQVSPASLDSVLERTDAFLHDQQATELSLFVVANWKFSVFGGGLVSLLAVIYVVAVIGGLMMKALQAVRGALSFPQE